MIQRVSPASVLTAACLVGLSLVAPAPVQAQSSRLGQTFLAVPPGTTGPLNRWPAVAFDSTNRVYLTVTGFGTIVGSFVSEDGAVIGTPFGISTPGEQQYPRVAYSPEAGVFLVTWLDTRQFGTQAAVWARTVRYTGSGGAAASGEFMVARATAGAGGGAHSESGPDVVYSTGSQEFLVTWMQYGLSGQGFYDIRGQRVNTAGQLAGSELFITEDAEWQAQPAAAYNPVDDEFAVIFTDARGKPEVSSARLRRIKAGTGAFVGGIVVTHVSSYVTTPQITWNTASGNYLVAWFSFAPAAGSYGQILNRDLSPVNPVSPLAIGVGSYDSLSIDYSTTAGVYFAVYHGFTSDDMGNEIGPTGVPDPAFIVTNSGGSGNFNPRIAAHSARAEWLMVSSRDFNRTVAQRIQSGSRKGGPPPPLPTSARIDLSTAAAPTGSWFFAEGATGGGTIPFDTYYLVSNEGNTPAEVRAYVSQPDGFTYEKEFVVEAHARKTTRLGDLVSAGSYGVVLQSKEAGEPIYAERETLWGGDLRGGAASAGVRTLSNTWYFAEGSTKFGFFDNYLLLMNPNQQTANVTISYFQPVSADQGSGAPVVPIVRQYTVPSQARLTVYANAISELANSDFSTTIASDQPIVAERSMFWGEGWEGGTNSSGATAPAPKWYFAEGAAATKFETYYTILNANPTPVSLKVTYLPENGTPVVRTYPIGASARYTILLNSEVGNVGGIGSTFETVGGESIVVERSIYWGAFPWVEGTNVMGATAPSSVWWLPEGSTANGFETFVLISNPNDVPVTVRLTGFGEDGAFVPTDFPIAANARLTLYMNNANNFPQLQGKSFATRVEALTQIGGVPAGIIAEHAVYWLPDPQSYWRGGSAAFGIPQ